MSQDITGFDMFCGAGGSSTGFVAAGGRLLGAANHWKLAIDTHNTNHPNVDHYLANISLSDPRAYPTTDVLIASPECVNHSSAKRKAHRTLWDPDDPKFAAEERSRATMFDVVRFAYQHRYKLVIVENVVEARNWELFDSWLGNMTALGYEHKAIFLNSRPNRSRSSGGILARPASSEPSLAASVTTGRTSARLARARPTPATGRPQSPLSKPLSWRLTDDTP